MGKGEKLLVIICGPTGVGKTAAAIHLATHFKTEIVSADSRQIYREMTIGTAKPTKEELNTIPHHFINHISIHDNFSAGQYEVEVLEKLDGLFQKHDIVVCAGGTGLYIKAISEGFDELPAIDKKVREEIIADYELNGLAFLQDAVQTVDPISYASIDIQNPQRLMRVLEVYRSSGKPLSGFKTQTPKARNFNILKIGLQLDREVLYQRINQRVDDMLKNGLLEEVKSLIPYQHLNALQTVGYSEWFDYLEGKTTYETAVELIKRNSRRYAKRQMTWFRSDASIQWLAPDEVERMIEKVIDIER
jgi:tRNA dimethylallyltransferase